MITAAGPREVNTTRSTTAGGRAAVAIAAAVTFLALGTALAGQVAFGRVAAYLGVLTISAFWIAGI